MNPADCNKHRQLGSGRADLIGNFANLEAGEAPNRDVLAEFGDRLGDLLPDSHRLVLDEVLFVEAALLVELLHLAGDDLLNNGVRLPGSARLRSVNLAFALEHFGRHVFPANVARINRGDMHGHVVAKLLKRIGARHEIAFAIDFHDHADFSAGMNVVADQSFGGFARGLLGRRGLAPLAQDLDSLLYEFLVVSRITQLDGGLDKRGAAITESSVREFSQFLDELGWDFHNWF